jgi:hypothetical protein
MPDKHAESPAVTGGEHTLCGIAPEAYEVGFADEPVIFAIPGQIITCKTCRAILDFCRGFKGYKA